jgi:Fe2+ or Zn2+ uptake regulation protein
MPQPQPADLDRAVRSRLGEQDVRYTSGRRRVVATLVQSHGPLSAAGLHRALDGDVPLSSLYRTLAVLAGAGILNREQGADGTARYELAEWLTGHHHHHLVCTECGMVQDVDISAAIEEEIGCLIERLAGTVGFTVTGHRIDIEGICPACRKV